MDLNKVKIFIKDQFPEFYREEFPQFVEFVKKYYEYLSTTKYSLMDSIKDVDNSIDEYISVLKKDFAINIPQFGKLSDRDFLIFAKQFYSSRGSQDSYKFLFRAIYGKEIDIIFPGEYVLKPSDGVWNQEISIRIYSEDVTHTFNSGETVSLSALDLAGQTFIIESQDGTKSRIECIRVNALKNNQYDLIIIRNYSGVIHINETLNFSKVFKDYNIGTLVESKTLTLTGNTLETPTKLTLLQSGSGFIAGTLYTIPTEIPFRFRIKKIDDGSRIVYTEIIQPGYDSANVLKKYYIIDSNDRNFLTILDNINSVNLTPTQALLKVEFGPLLKYPGFFINSKGFLSDAIKLHDNSYYQSFSYILRLDEQLESYKTLVKRLLHPAGMALWAEYSIYGKIEINATIQNIVNVLKLFVEDDLFPTPIDSIVVDFSLKRDDSTIDSDTITINYSLDRKDSITEPDNIVIDYHLVRADSITDQIDKIIFDFNSVLKDTIDPTPDAITINYSLDRDESIFGEDKMTFGVSPYLVDTISLITDSGSVSISRAQDYADPSYFLELYVESGREERLF